MLTKRVFQENMAVMAEAIGKEDLTPEKIRIYWRILSPELTDDQMRRATEHLARTAKFFPAIAEIREAAGVRSVLALYRKAPHGKCACGLELSFPESHRRGYCGKYWRGILDANGVTDADEGRELAAIRGDPPPAIPRSRGTTPRITGGDFDV